MDKELSNHFVVIPDRFVLWRESQFADPSILSNYEPNPNIVFFSQAPHYYNDILTYPYNHKYECKIPVHALKLTAEFGPSELEDFLLQQVDGYKDDTKYIHYDAYGKAFYTCLKLVPNIQCIFWNDSSPSEYIFLSENVRNCLNYPN